ncbi:MAG: flagellar basal body-associated FliL family protein [Pseudomonadales bacterium]
MRQMSHCKESLKVLVAGLLLIAGSAALAEEAAAPADVELRYLELKPTFVTNYGLNTSPRLKYIKTDIAVRVAGLQGESMAMEHLPALRHALVMLLSRQSDEQIATGGARELVREEAKQLLNEILTAESGEPYVHDLLFTNFIVQR